MARSAVLMGVCLAACIADSVLAEGAGGGGQGAEGGGAPEACDASDCHNHGTPSGAKPDCTCACDAGFSGAACSVQPVTMAPPAACDASDCSHHGTASGNKGSCSCACNAGSTGHDCSIQACDRSDCSNHGSATGTRPDCECTCDDGWLGDTCLGEEVGVTPTDGGNATHGITNQTTQVFGQIYGSLNNQLENGPFQWINGIFALVLGGMMLWDGEKFFKQISVAFIGLAVYVIAWTVLQDSYPMFNWVIDIILAAEVCAIAMAIALYGFEGIKTGMGLALALAICYYVRLAVRDKAGDNVADNWIFMFVCFNASLALGIHLFAPETVTLPFCNKEIPLGKGHKRSMGFICPFFGSAILSSALYFFAFLVCQLLVEGDIGGHPLSQDNAAYIDFLYTLLPHVTLPQPVGIFCHANWTINQYGGGVEVWGLDRIIERSLWILLFIIGVAINMKRVNKQGGGGCCSRKGDRSKSKTQPLLQS